MLDYISTHYTAPRMVLAAAGGVSSHHAYYGHQFELLCVC